MVSMQQTGLQKVMRQAFMQPARETMLVAHIQHIIVLPVGKPVDRGGHQWVKEHKTPCRLWAGQPVMFTGKEQDGKYRGLNQHGVVFDDAHGSQVADFQGIQKVRQVDGMPPQGKLFLEFIERKLNPSLFVQKHPIASFTSQFAQRLFHQLYTPLPRSQASLRSASSTSSSRKLG